MNKNGLARRSFIGILGLILLVPGFWIWGKGFFLSSPAEEYFTITAFPIGKADALLLQEGRTAILVDTGEKEDGPFLLQELEKRGIGRLDLLMITHFDKDHVGSASFLMDNLNVEMVMMPDYEGDRTEYYAFLKSLEAHPDVRRIAETVQFSIGRLDWTVYPAEAPGLIQDTAEEYDNDMSLVADISYGMKSFLLTGDIEKKRIAQMLSSDVDWKHDWIKMPHHGRYQKVLDELMEQVEPSWAVICCSEKKPAEDKTLKLLEKRQISVWDTSKYSVVTMCDGETIEVRYDL